MAWTDLGEAWGVGGVRVAKGARGPVAVFRVAEDEVRAVADRCPHEGYPLAQGTVCGEVLTCCHHNFKFDLRSGACLLGDEAADVFPAKIEGGRVWVDLTPPDPAPERARRWASLDRAVFDGKLGQIARDVVRLLDLGATPAEIAAFTAAWDADHAPYGSSHALALALVGLRIARPGLDAAWALVPALELAAEEGLRSAVHPAAAPQHGSIEDLRAAIAAEDLPRAEGLARGLDPADAVRAVILSTTDQFVDYGHSLIYAVAARDLLAYATPAQRTSIAVGLVRSTVLATREQAAPSWSTYRKQVAALDGRWSALASGAGTVDARALADALVAAGPRDAVDLVVGALERGSPAGVLDALSLAAAERLLRFDPAYDADPTVQDAWLDLTHLQTFAHAAREAWGDVPAEDAVRWLLQAARLIARVRPLDLAEVPTREPVPGDLREAVLARDPERAAAVALATDPDQARTALIELAQGDLAVRPLFVAHHLKQVVAACAEAEAVGDRRPIAAAARFLAARKSERRTLHRVGEALALVRDGRPPRVLAF
jgi:nitrite reductase/ring-hydroxylating ferredoxin subunit